MMSKEWSTKNVNFMTPWAGVIVLVIVLGHGHTGQKMKCIISLKIFFPI